MRTKFLLTACFALATSVCTSSVLAQNAPETEFTPKNFSLVDERGVDLAQRSLNIQHSISIGDARNGLQYSASYSSSGTWKFYHSVLSYARVDHLQDPDTGHTASVWYLSYNGSSEAMDPAGAYYSGDLGSRLYLCGSNCASSATLADGTVLTFDTTPLSVSQTGNIFKLLSAVRPNGERRDYHYDPITGAFRAVTNNYGYQLKFIPLNPSSGAFLPMPSSVVLFNMAVDPCSATATSCSYSRTWPRLTFASNSSSMTVTETVGAQTVYTYGGSSQKIENVNGPGNRDYSVTYQDCGALPPFGQCNAGGQSVGGWRVQTVNVAGRTWTYSWDPALTPGTGSSAHGVRVTHAAGYVGYRSFVVPFAGQGIFDIYQPADRMVSIRDELSRTTLLEHTGFLNPKLSKITHPEGNGTQYTYDLRGNITTIRQFPKPGSPLGDLYTYLEYAEAGNTTDCSQPAYCNKVLRIRDPRGFVTRYVWNPTTGTMTSMERGLQGPSNSLTCNFGADLCPKTMFGYTTFNAYYLNGSAQLVAGSSINLLSSTARCEDNANCGPADQVVSTYGYGSAGVANNLLLRTESVGKNGFFRTTTFAYDAVGDRIEVDGPRTDVTDITRFAWDLARRPTDTVNADGSASRRSYSTEGFLHSSSLGTSTGIGQFTPYVTTSFEYDPAGNVTRKTTPTSATQYKYDSVGRLLCTAERMNPAVFGSLPSDGCQLSTSANGVLDRITRNTYDAAGQTTLIQRAFATPIVQNYATYGYTLNGKPDWVKDANGNRSDYTYDWFDRLERLTFPSTTLGANVPNGGDYESYTYDENGNRKTVRLRSGETITSWFDALNREWWHDLPTGDDVYSGFDLLNRVKWKRHASPSGQGVDYVYNAWGEPLTESAYGRTLTYSYDSAGNRTHSYWPDSNYIQYTYDSMNRVDHVRENGATSGAGLLADYSYDVLGRRSTLVRGNGTTTIWSYDVASRLGTLTQDLAGTNKDLSNVFTYNAANQIVSRGFSNDSYQYVAAVLTQAYSRDGLNRYAAVSGATYAYDLRGNLTNNGVRAFTYDLENRLTRVDAATGSPTQLSLTYDPQGRLRQTVGLTTTQFLYSGSALVAEFNSSGAMTHRYVHGPGVDEPMVWYEGSGFSSTTRRWLHANHQGSIIATTDGTGALLGTEYSYAAFGEPDTTHGWFGSRFRYTGQITLPEAALYHYKARAYEPKVGRFLQTDPVGYKDDLNLYAYVRNDPLGRRDPTGKTGASAATAEVLEEIIVRGTKEAAKTTIATDLAIILAVPVIVFGPSNGWVGSDEIKCRDETICIAMMAEKDRASKTRKSKPVDAPTGTKPIDQVGLTKDEIHKIKEGIGAGSEDYVGIAPNGDIITTDPETGKSVSDNGKVSDFTD